tara:strand:- start:81 stop:698 length:618 start_codon:yes stop_codon:yes gene_type:complete
VDIQMHQGDLPADVDFGMSVAIDTETMGLNLQRDRLCLIQMSAGDGTAHLVQFAADDDYAAPNLKKMLADPAILKIYHYARFDVGVLQRRLGVVAGPIYCTKIASRLTRTYTDRHGLKDLCRELLGVELSKQQQSSDWGAPDLSNEQRQYAASDVLYLHDLKSRLDTKLARLGRTELADKCFAFVPTRVALDLAGWEEADIFAHS